jgi:hypothetical protein
MRGGGAATRDEPFKTQGDALEHESRAWIA